MNSACCLPLFSSDDLDLPVAWRDEGGRAVSRSRRRLLAEAAEHLNPGGILAVEIGHNREIVEAAFPDLPFQWLSTRGGDDMVFLLRREDL